MYRKNSSGWVKHIDFIILDLLCLACLLFVICAAPGRLEPVCSAFVPEYGNLCGTGRYYYHIFV